MPQTGKLRRGKGSANHGTCHALDSEANQLPSALQPWESHCRSLVVLNFFSSYLGKSDDIAPILLSFLLKLHAKSLESPDPPTTPSISTLDFTMQLK
jgi:hypothetical protein